MVTSNTRSENGQKSVVAPYRLSKEIGRSRIRFRLGVCVCVFSFFVSFSVLFFFFLCVGVLRNRREDVDGPQKERGLSRVLRSRYVGPGFALHHKAWQSQSQSQSLARQGSAKQLHYRT